VMVVYLDRERILLDPPYQREGDVWALYKRQLLIDSLINGYDIPKIYFHEYDKAQRKGERLYKYAIVDGKQRLSAIWQFMDNGFRLGTDIEYLRDKTVKLKGLNYDELRREHPAIHARFTGRSLSIITIRTDDMDLIEDMFSRLNEAVPLNAAEQRNAFGGPIPIVIRQLVKDEFFTDRLTVSSTRYRHHDLACKFLYLESKGGEAETKKKTLDAFVREYENKQFKKRAQELLAEVRLTLGKMCEIFSKTDPLLRSPGNDVIYFLLCRELRLGSNPQKLSRRDLEQFEAKLKVNRKAAEEELPTAEWELLEYDRLSQTPNDASAIEFRLKTIRKYLFEMEKGA